MVYGSDMCNVMEIRSSDLEPGQNIELNNQQYRITDCSFGKGGAHGRAHVSARNILTF